MRKYTGFLVVFLFLHPTVMRAAEPDPKADLATVKDYLAKEFPGKKWQAGPTRVDTAEIRQVFPGQRFYIVRSSPPLPPGAALPELIQAFQKKMAEYRKTALNATVRIDSKGKLSVLRKATDLNHEMKKVTNEKEVKAAAAAAATLNPGGTAAVGTARAQHVQAQRRGEFWTAVVTVPRSMRGGVTFDKEGKFFLVSVKATPIFPPAVPPSAPPGLPPRRP